MGLVLSEPWDVDFNLLYIVNAPKSHKRYNSHARVNMELLP